MASLGVRPFRAVILLALLGALCLALSACGGGGSSSGSADAATKAGASKARTYTPALKASFRRECVRLTQAKHPGKFSSEKVSTACDSLLLCLSHRLTVRQLTQTVHKMQTGAENPGAKTLSECKQQGREKLTQ